MFAPEDACDNVHSQSRRMFMVSPEPGFWIHAVSFNIILKYLCSVLPFRVDSVCVDVFVIVLLPLVRRASKDATRPSLG
jgi:hypothetical protein